MEESRKFISVSIILTDMVIMFGMEFFEIWILERNSILLERFRSWFLIRFKRGGEEIFWVMK